ncbi:hypothetical protein [Marinobacter sp. X15-166B]|uniref:phage major tropism determinant n=1 Tax=Marinobacter sp. X15-166B TaxID=1897620 RepID=UPI00085C8E3B|nr:hypothetical protein [Marinobacter sp. X15-166B]OEY67454.1 hypothetical protein BG841_14110 [Marinobacter sp. X15-166B]
MATGDRIIIPAMAAGFVSIFGRIEKGTGDTLNLPEGMVNIGGNSKGYLLENTGNWDPVTNSDGSFASLALGDDVYIYAVQDASGIAQWIASKNSTVPTGYTADNSRKIGGFHFGKVRPLADAYNAAAALPTQIIPNSCWDLKHRPKCDPSGMVEVIPGQLWVDIYLASEDSTPWPNTVPISVHNATPLTGTEGYSRLDYSRLVRNAGKRLPDYSEFMMFAYGVPQGTTGASGRQSTGGHAGYGFECVSCLNVDQPSGNLYQQSSLFYDRDTGVGWKDDLNTGKDGANNHGQWYGGQFRTALFGAGWYDAGEAGSRSVALNSVPWDVSAYVGLRGVCDSL